MGEEWDVQVEEWNDEGVRPSVWISFSKCATSVRKFSTPVDRFGICSDCCYVSTEPEVGVAATSRAGRLSFHLSEQDQLHE